MFDEPDEPAGKPPSDPAVRASEKAEEFRMHAELCAVFEGPRKFDASLQPGLDADLARDIQRRVGKLEKARTADLALLSEPAVTDAAALLNLFDERGLSTNDYHIHRRPGEAMIVRWLQGEQVDTFYTRMQAHFDAALEGFKEDERQSLEWKQDAGTAAYLAAIDAIEVKISDLYVRDAIRQHNLFLLSTQAADELNIAFLSDQVMGVTPADIVGSASAPPDEPTESDLAWFFKLFLLRGMKDGVEQICCFTYLQKSDDSGW